MNLLLALVLSQLGEAPHLMVHLQNGLDGAQLITKNVDEFNRDVHDPGFAPAAG